jgi:hypothetical protein
MSGLRLVPLQCATCAGRLSGATGTAVLLCAGCGAGFEVMDDGALAGVSVSFARYTKDSNSFYPFWTFDAHLRLRARDSNRPSGEGGGLATRFQELGSLRFYCAAFLDDIEKKGGWSLHLTLNQPVLQAADSQKELGAVAFSQAEARLLASDLFVTSELTLPDIVRALRFELELADPRVVGIAL